MISDVPGRVSRDINDLETKLKLGQIHRIAFAQCMSPTRDVFARRSPDFQVEPLDTNDGFIEQTEVAAR